MMRRARGFVLIYTLWLTAAAAVLLGYLTTQMKAAPLTSREQLEHLVAMREAFGITAYVLKHTRGYTTRIDKRYVTYETAAATSQTERQRLVNELTQILSQIDMKVDLGKLDQADIETQVKAIEEDYIEREQGRVFGISDKPYTLRLTRREARVHIAPPNAWPSLNHLESAALERYLGHLGVPEARARRLTGAIIDWRDSDDFLSPDGAEFTSYATEGLPRNDLFRNWGELAMLHRIDPGLLRRIRDAFSIHGPDTRMNARYFDAGQIAVLADMEPLEAQLILDNRELPSDEQLQLKDLLTPEKASRFNRLFQWKSNNDVMRIRVENGTVAITTVFDSDAQMVLDRFLDEADATAAAPERSGA